MANAAEVSFSKPETTFSGFLAGVPAELKAAATGRHTVRVALEFDGGGIDAGNVVSLAAVGVPGCI
jgi:hypothetical protein